MGTEEQRNNLAEFGEAILDISSPLHAIRMLNAIISKVINPEAVTDSLETEIWYLTELIECFVDITEKRMSKNKTLKEYTGIDIEEIMYR